MNNPSLFINGRWVAGQGALLTSLDPATGGILWQSDGAAADQVSEAVQAARSAFPDWAGRPLEARIACLKAFQHLLDQHAEVMAEYIGQETGKPLWDSRTEVSAMLAKVDISLRAYHERSGSQQTQSAGVTSQLQHRPHGVMAVLGPYNFPGHLPNGHLVPALLAGNCVVFKPSSYTPRVAEQLVELWHEAGLPPGVLNLLQGDAGTGKHLVADHGIDGVLFTGSRRVGELLQQLYADRPGKLLALEMGGNNPLIYESAKDPRAAVHLCIQSAYLSAGQRCTCARRLLVPTGVEGDRLIDDLVRAAQRIRVGAYDADPEPFMGPVISVAQAEQLLDAQVRLRDLGGQPLLAMQPLKAGTGLLSPGIMEVSGIYQLPDEEYFGPLLQIQRYEGFEQALVLANRTVYGLSAGLISTSRERFARFQAVIRAGIQNWNRPLTGASSALPFGGIGASGNLRPSAYYAADYCAYPVASQLSDELSLPAALSPGLTL